MAYIPGYKHDVFLSYSSKDRDWVVALQEQLADRLGQPLGGSCDIWWDDLLRNGQNWTQEIQLAIEETAAFIAVLSPSYQDSAYCDKEVEQFLGGQDPLLLRTAGFDRFLKVIKFPWYENSHLGFYPQIQHEDFYHLDPKSQVTSEFPPSSVLFQDGVNRLASHIHKLFLAMLMAKFKVYVARPAEPHCEMRDQIVREIKAMGFAIVPPPNGGLPRGMDRATLAKFTRDAAVTVHVVGAAPDPAVREQILLARDAGKRVIACLANDCASASGDEAKFIADIRNNKLRLPDGSWHLLEGSTTDRVITELKDLLTPKPAPTKRPDGAPASVYLLCDPTTKQDLSFAQEVQQAISDREKMHVELPTQPSDRFSPAERHEHLLNECDGLLVYMGGAPDAWCKRNLSDLESADRRRARKLKSKALLVGRAAQSPAGVIVIPRLNPFDLNQLEPFLGPLRPGSGLAST
jgi:hypothetical protein